MGVIMLFCRHNCKIDRITWFWVLILLTWLMWMLVIIIEILEEVTQMGMIIKFLKKKINIWKILGWMKQMWLK